MNIKKLKEALTFDDLLILPNYSDLVSIRNETSVSTWIHTLELGIPIISAAMTTVTDRGIQEKMSWRGGLGIFPRYWPPNTEKRDVVINTAKALRYGAIAVSPSMLDIIPDILNRYHDIYGDDLREKIAVIDVAHGNRKEVLDFASVLVSMGFEVWSGNVVTPDAAYEYLNRGVEVIKVGIGPGSACSTRVVSGCGYPQAQAINDIKSSLGNSVSIIADGGIKTSGDIVKALALGADAVILGGLIAGTVESPAEMTVYPATLCDISDSAKMYKRYRGMASKEELEGAGKTVRVEGVSGLVPVSGTLGELLDSLVSGIKTGMGYVGARNISELRERARFVRVTQAGVIEGQPRI